ncbi:MAG: hypothetical protein LH473_05295 [Chitinophagales bacterium]|nr:hypothetical protein [Chitinophagales bacterium]
MQVKAKYFGEISLKECEQLYDKYAPSMYGIIQQLTNDKLLVDEIFMTAFIGIKEKQILSETSESCYPFLMRYTYNFAIRELKRQGIKPIPIDKHNEVELILLLCTRCSSLKEVAYILNITTEEAKKKLHEEFRELRTGHEKKGNLIQATSNENNPFNNSNSNQFDLIAF